MRMAIRTLASGCGALLLASLTVSAEDLAITFQFTTKDGAPKTTTTYITSDKMRHSTPDQDLIVEYSTGRMVFINHAKKEYWETTRDEMNAAFQRTADQMKQVSDQMKQNPQAAKMLEGLMGGIAASISVQKGTGAKKIAGYDCDQYLVGMGDAVKMELWTTTALALPPRAVEAQTALLTQNPMFSRSGAAMVEKMSQIKGFALATSTSMSLLGKSMVTSSEASEVKKGPVPASAFEVPAGYKKVESPMSKMMKGPAPKN